MHIFLSKIIKKVIQTPVILLVFWGCALTYLMTRWLDMSIYWPLGMIVYMIGVHNDKGAMTLAGIILVIGLYNYFESKPFKLESFQSDEELRNTKAEKYLNNRYLGQDINLVFKDFEASGLECGKIEAYESDEVAPDGKKAAKGFGCKYTTNTISLQPFYDYYMGAWADSNDETLGVRVQRKYIIGK
jgi:hypothetical protein